MAVLEEIGMISVTMPSGEAREPKLRSAVEKDKQKRFEWSGNSSEIPGDAQFRLEENENIEKVFNLELKDFTGDQHSDFLASLMEGHLYLQSLKLRRDGAPCAICLLGNETDLDNAIQESVLARGFRGDKASDMMLNYRNMCYDFEAECHGLHIGFWWYKDRPWRRILSSVHKILTGGDLSQYAPDPVKGEEQAVALSILAGNGFGPVKSKSILEKFSIALEPDRHDYYLTDCPGIGEKLAIQLAHSENIQVSCQNICRPKVKKAKMIINEGKK